MVSSIFKKNADINGTPIPITSRILENPIIIAPGELSPGGAAHLRIWLTIRTTTNTTTAIAVTVNDNAAIPDFFHVNPEADFDIKSGALYWFDIPIEEGDHINLQSINAPDGTPTAQIVTGITVLRFQKIVFGA